MASSKKKLFSPPKSSGIMDFFRGVPPGGKYTAASEIPEDNNTISAPPSCMETQTLTKPNRLQRLKRTMRVDGSIRLSKESHLDPSEVTVIMESSNSSDDVIFRSEAEKCSGAMASDQDNLLPSDTSQKPGNPKRPQQPRSEDSPCYSLHPPNKLSLKELGKKYNITKKRLKNAGPQQQHCLPVTQEVEHSMCSSSLKRIIDDTPVVLSVVCGPEDGIASSEQEPAGPNTPSDVLSVFKGHELTGIANRTFASIFSCRWDDRGEWRMVTCPQEKPLTLEEEVEVVVVEADSTSKCAQAGSKQITKALKQPSVKVSQSKPRSHKVQKPTQVGKQSEKQRELQKNDQPEAIRKQITKSTDNYDPKLAAKLRSQHCQGSHRERRSGWREEFSEQSRKALLEEIGVHNRQFPVRRFFTMLLRKRTEHEMECATLESEESPKASLTLALPIGGKRKRGPEGQGIIKTPKISRPCEGLKDVTLVEHGSPAGHFLETSEHPPMKLASRSRLSRTRRHRQQQTGSPDAVCKSITNETIHLLKDRPPQSYLGKDCVREDVPWTEKYQPQHSSEVIGNSVSVKKLHSWLKEWKLRADCEERSKRREDKRQEDNSNESWDCGDFQGEAVMEEIEQLLCNTLLITGPTGVGKTAVVYACAQELGFKVFEVNASSQRSGRLILSQLKEATQSHQVDPGGVTTFKPTYLNTHSSSSAKPATSPRKVDSARKVLSSSRKASSIPRNGLLRKGSRPPITLTHYFKISGKPESKNSDGLDHRQHDAHQVRPAIVKEADTLIKGSSSKLPADNKSALTTGHSKKSTTSLILFEEVDIIFNEDVGLLAAIKTFMTTTKRPVILTTSDSSFSGTFDGHFEELYFKTPSMENVISYLQLLCLVENVRTEPGDITSLLRLNKGDVRRSLLQLQLWVRSGGGRTVRLPLSHSSAPPAPAVATQVELETPSATMEDETTAKQRPTIDLPHCDTGCSESLLGFQNIESKRDLESVLKCTLWAEPEHSRCLELLMESWRGGVDLLYSNMEMLLPLPTTASPSPALVPPEAPRSGLQQRSAPTDLALQTPVPLSETRPGRLSSRPKGRNGLSLKGSRKLVPDPNVSHEVLSLAESQEVTPPSTCNHQCTRRACGPSAEQRASGLVSCCLGSLAEFLENMSFLDSYLHNQALQMAGPCRPGSFGWTGAELKEGLLDELGEEELVRWCGRQSSSEIRAMLEGLGFQRCQAGVSEAWRKAQRLAEELSEERWARVVEECTLPVSPHRQGLCFNQTTLCEPSMDQRCNTVLKAVLSSRAFSTRGNKTAIAMDYLPTLRSICRSEKLKDQGKVKYRFLHYLKGIHLGLPKGTIQLLSYDFP